MLKTKLMPWLPWWPPVDGGEVKQAKKFSVVAVALLLGLAGCGTTPKLEGADIPNAKEFLEKADAEFKEVYSRATPRPAKPLVRQHLRTAMNEPQGWGVIKVR